MGGNVDDTAWQSALANGSAAAMDRGRFRAIATLYAQYARIQKLIDSDAEFQRKTSGIGVHN